MGPFLQNLGDVGAKGLLIGWILGRGIRVLLPLDDGVGQQLTGGSAENAFFPSIEGLEAPRDVEHVVHQAVIAERHPDLEADRHAHAVLAVEQKLDEARQVQISVSRIRRSTASSPSTPVPSRRRARRHA